MRAKYAIPAIREFELEAAYLSGVPDGHQPTLLVFDHKQTVLGGGEPTKRESPVTVSVPPAPEERATAPPN